jgi:hypothetical protein
MFGAHRIEQAKLLSRRDVMPIYISRGRFTSDAVRGMLAKPENREEAVSKLFGLALNHDAADRAYERLTRSEGR